MISRFHPQASGAERQALAQGIELTRRGHSAHVVTRAIAGCPRDETIEGVRVHRWIDPSHVGPLFGLTFVAGVVRALRRLRPEYDVIHTHQGLWEAIAVGLGRDAFSGAPILIQPASSGYYGEAQEMARTKGFRFLRAMALRNRLFAAISADIEKEWKALGVPSERIVRMASGVDAERFQPGSSALEATLPPRPRVMFTGRLHPQKNLDLLIEIWPEVARRTGATLMLVGDGPERGRLEARCCELGIAAQVVFTGAVADPADSLRAADVFVLPSVAEGMSNSLLEAMATGLPCLASDIGGNTDLIEMGRTGRLVAPDDGEAWTEAIVETLADRQASQELGWNARRRIEEGFALPVVVDRYLELYRRMLSREIAS